VENFSFLDLFFEGYAQLLARDLAIREQILPGSSVMM
jgi:hypothetical protein